MTERKRLFKKGKMRREGQWVGVLMERGEANESKARIKTVGRVKIEVNPGGIRRPRLYGR